MTQWLAAARQAQRAGTQLTQPTKAQPDDVSSVMSVVSEGVEAEPAHPARYDGPRVADLAGVATENPKASPSAKQTEKAFPYGASVGGRPLTYTGRVVSLEAWRSLSEWEKHGPRGRL